VADFPDLAAQMEAEFSWVDALWIGLLSYGNQFVIDFVIVVPAASPSEAGIEPAEVIRLIDFEYEAIRQIVSNNPSMPFFPTVAFVYTMADTSSETGYTSLLNTECPLAQIVAAGTAADVDCVRDTQRYSLIAERIVWPGRNNPQ
jgi:hypothetical protein